MLTRAWILALSALTPIAFLAASCLADGPDDGLPGGAPPEEALAHPVNPIPPGPCATACRMVVSGGCTRWQDECADAYPDDENVTCGDHYLTCSAAQHAALNSLYGQMWCYRACEKLD